MIYDTLDIKYTGYDVYKKVIEYNNIKHKLCDKYCFKYLDIYNNREEIKESMYYNTGTLKKYIRFLIT